MSNKQVTLAQWKALRDWQDRHGMHWRGALLGAWERAGEGTPHYTPELQQLRNSQGPAWLARQTVAGVHGHIDRLQQLPVIDAPQIAARRSV